MERYFSEFYVEIIDERYENKFLKTETTAVVSFFNDKGEVIEKLKLGVVEPKKIYQRIENNKELQFPGSYIKGFSLSEYRNKLHCYHYRNCHLN